MPFSFRLEPLITIRDNVLKKKQGELAKAYEARRIVETKRTEIDSALKSVLENGRTMIQPGKAVNVDFLLGLRRQEMYLLADRNDCDEKIRILDEEIERRRQIVIEANKELKTVEKLKEKKREIYNAEQTRRETVEMDEVAGNRVSR
ncbi:MAG: flagellar export protein FliJ [Planctomycetaceae bacterium]|jgi:flagellar FliJ protein|nr:flagellar export protein FliJ [Planctomycetaceae bacterium]